MVKCEVCSTSEHKYKCPKCLIKYCSLACYKQHQGSNCVEKPPSVDKEKVEPKPLQFQSEDSVPLEKLEMLRHDKPLLTSLENPHLRQIMLNINSSSDPGVDLKKAMQEPIFTEFADHCMRITSSKDTEIVLPTK
ncbi:Zinc finger HIT domain-containing protein 3 [Chamberlinius hualienensis]